MGLWSERAMRETVAKQFNEEQLVIAGHIAHLIEKELHRLEKEMILAGEDIAAQMPESVEMVKIVRQSFDRILESGVRKIEIVDLEKRRSLIFIPYRHWWEEGTGTCIKDKFSLLDMDDHHSVWISPPLIQSSGLRLFMALALAGDTPRAACFSY